MLQPAPSDASAPDAEPVTVNKRELALRLRISLPTLTAWIDRWPDFPVEQRGALGSSWRFVFADVAGFLAGKKAEEAAGRSERDEQLAHLQLSFDELMPPSPDRPLKLTVKEELEAWKLREMKRKEAERCGQLLVASEVRELMAAAFARLSRDTSAFVRQICREGGMPDPVIRAIEQRLAQQQRDSVAELTRQLVRGQPETEPERLFAR